MSNTDLRVDVAIVGGGLAGLAAAAMLARAGRTVVVLEKAPRLGGRGVTQMESGYSFNLGPHALYRGGHAMRVLRQLGIEPVGGVPSQVGGFAVRGGRKYTLPVGALSLLTTDLVGVAGKIGIARALTSLPRLESARFDDMTWAEWCDGHVRDAIAREFLTAIVRLSTYTNASTRLSAGAAIRQVQMALADNVLYLDGGWQTIVDELRRVAVDAGAELRLGSRVDSIAVAEDSTSLAVAGDAVVAAAVVLAVPPKIAAGVLDGAPGAAVAGWAAELVPVRAACLDVGLTTLPKSRNLFALGVDAPLYLSVHTAVARLAESGKAVVQVAKYLPVEGGGTPVSVESELEDLLDLVQPGWRDVVEERRFLPEMIVANAVVEASRGGWRGRPGPGVPGTSNVFVVGDWVGSEGMLLDAGMASAEFAVNGLLKGVPGVRDAA